MFVDLILPFALNNLFTYSVPEEMQSALVERVRVIVSFGPKKYYTGIVERIHFEKPIGYETKNIAAIVDQTPVISKLQLDFWKWVAEYYMCSIGEVMKAALPASLKMESETTILLNPDFENFEILDSIELLVMDLLKNKKQVLLKDIEIKEYKKSIIPLINCLQDKEAIYIQESIRDKYSPRTEVYVRLSEMAADENFLNEIHKSLKKAPKQAALLENYLIHSKTFDDEPLNEIKKAHLLELSNTGPATLNSLIEKGVFEIYKKERNRLTLKSKTVSTFKTLNEAQKEAYEKIKNSFLLQQVVLLHGITSSGKTEIYIHLIQDYLDKNQQVLYLLPEIAITAQIIHRLQKYFGNKVSVYHSKYTDNERVEIWKRLQTKGQDKFHIILGVRSSIFLPFENLGLIIIDEEHETSFKQYNPAPRYNARDAAMVLASMHKAKVLLGTATPAVESYYNALSGKYGLITLTTRYQDIKLPETQLVNMPQARKKGNVKSHFSNQLLEAIENCLTQNKQVILFQNRRGFSPFIECPECGWAPKCKHCDVTLTYHKFQNQLICHYCSYAVKVPGSCSECSNKGIKTVGFGTEKIEEELSLMFPQAEVARMDLDSTSNKHAHENIISAFESGRIDILVGTQMISKGLDFSNVTLTGILNADNLLNFPDFRAYERSFQLMVQVGGRAGRKNERGKVIIQTSMPGHEIIKEVINNDYLGMYQNQIAERAAFKYPPFYRLIAITLKHKDEKTCMEASIFLTKNLSGILGKRVLGPDKPLISKIQNLFLRNILLKLERDAALQKIKKSVSDMVNQATAHFKGLQISIDVDPL